MNKNIKIAKFILLLTILGLLMCLTIFPIIEGFGMVKDLQGSDLYESLIFAISMFNLTFALSCILLFISVIVSRFNKSFLHIVSIIFLSILTIEVLTFFISMIIHECKIYEIKRELDGMSQGGGIFDSASSLIATMSFSRISQLIYMLFGSNILAMGFGLFINYWQITSINEVQEDSNELCTEEQKHLSDKIRDVQEKIRTKEMEQEYNDLLVKLNKMIK